MQAALYDVTPIDPANLAIVVGTLTLLPSSRASFPPSSRAR